MIKAILITAFETLEYCANKYSPNRHSSSFYSDKVLDGWSSLLKDDKLLNELQQISGWIPPQKEFEPCGNINIQGWLETREFTPPCHDMLLIYDGQQVTTGMYYRHKNKFRNSTGYKYENEEVTHWQLLTNPPGVLVHTKQE